MAVVLGLYMLSRRDTMTVRGLASRAGAYVLGAFVGVLPLLLYNHAAFDSWTHLAYSNIPQQQRGFFGISAPSLRVLATLLFDSRGLLTISPVLGLGAIGTFLLYRRGRRAEALTITGVCLCFLIYNSGYYLPFGGGAPGPRFMITMLPFLGCPLGLVFKRFPGPSVALAAASIVTTGIATITHPLVGYENETVVWTRLLSKGEFQPTIASAFGAGRGWGAIWPFLLAVAAAAALAVVATPRLRIGWRSALSGVAVLAGWALFAALAPTLLGIDHRGLIDIKGAGDPTAFNLPLHNGARYPLDRLVLYAGIAGALAVAVLAALRVAPRGGRSRAGREPAPA